MYYYSDICNRISELRKDRLPFVVFSAPDSDSLKLIWQLDHHLHLFDPKDSSGFVMAPFSHDQAAYYIPDTHEMEADVSNFKIPETAAEGVGSIPKANVDIELNSGAAERHRSLVVQAITQIKESHFEKVVLARKETIPTDIDPQDLFSRLLGRYPAAFCYWFYHPKLGTWQGATPELLMQISTKGLQTISLAGTRVYDPLQNPDWTSKEFHEQQLVTQDIMARLSELPLSPSQGDTYSVRAGNLWHLRTDIKSEITKDTSLSELIKALHPSPAISGLPRAAARTFIRENENFDRSFYAGYLGLVKQAAGLGENFEKELSLFVNLRCISLENNQAHLYVGSGITIDSDPDKEWEETVHKAQTMSVVLKP